MTFPSGAAKGEVLCCISHAFLNAIACIDGEKDEKIDWATRWERRLRGGYE
jgi:hypothetical protein